jgi:NADH pyrophosphatase NudC (nudix superfamily)
MIQYIVVRSGEDATAYGRMFATREKAKEFAKQVAERVQEDWPDSTLINFENEVVIDRYALDLPSIVWRIEHIVSDDEPSRVCPHCGKRVTPSETGDYRWQCKDCDEDFYDAECVASN